MLNIKKVREESGLTQAKFAAAAGVNRSNLAKWETGKGYPKGEDYNKIVLFITKKQQTMSADADIWRDKYEQLLERENQNKQLLLQSFVPLLESFGINLAAMLETQKKTLNWTKAHVRNEANVRAKDDPTVAQTELDKINKLLFDIEAGIL